MIKNLTVKVLGSEIKCEKIVKLFGVDIDYQLNLYNHISNLCRKAGQQLNVLKRLNPYLSKLNKLTISIHLYCPVLIIALLHGIFAQKKEL